MMTQIGDVMPWAPRPGLLGAQLDQPEWFILRTVSQKEKATAAKLAKHGVTETWYPAETAWRIQRNAKRDRVEVERLVAPGYLFAEFERTPVWHRVFETLKGFVIGVVGIDGVPFAVPEATIAKMRLVPKRIELLREEESARDKARRLASQPMPGKLARLTEGPFSGKVVDVTRIDYGIAFYLLEGVVKGQAKVDALERVEALP